MTVTIANPHREAVPEDLINRWRKIPVAVIVDLSPRLRQIDPGIRPLRPAGSQPPLFGRAITAECVPPDFGAVMYAIDICQAGDVLMIAADDHVNHAMIGEILGGKLRSAGVAGVVCDGAIRDAAGLAGWDDFSVYCRSINPRGPVEMRHGSINTPVTLGATMVHPGDFVTGDDDGLVALSPAEMVEWIDAAETQLETEASWQQRLKAGESMESVFELATAESVNLQD